jgi:7-carboxy-7-deazaguanine synthase
MEKFLTVSESFYSLQGEGQTTGTPAVFLRLAGCNLLCQSSSWVCDSIEVWQKGTAKPFNMVLIDKNFEALNRGAHLVITGGEPLLHQKKLVEYLQWFEGGYGWLPVIEIETNGTIIPNEYLQEKVSYWNCSPKLSTSSEPASKRINEVALAVINKCRNPMFKFVISTQDDFLELYDFENYIFWKYVYLMPAGCNQEELAVTRPIVAELCKTMGVKFTDRTHINIWNKKTGV